MHDTRDRSYDRERWNCKRVSWIGYIMFTYSFRKVMHASSILSMASSHRLHCLCRNQSNFIIFYYFLCCSSLSWLNCTFIVRQFCVRFVRFAFCYIHSKVFLFVFDELSVCVLAQWCTTATWHRSVWNTREKKHWPKKESYVQRMFQFAHNLAFCKYNNVFSKSAYIAKIVCKHFFFFVFRGGKKERKKYLSCFFGSATA